MNKVYFAIVDEDAGGTHISAPNIKEAKKIASSCEIINEHLENWIDLRVRLCRRKDKSPVTTDEPSGELDISKVISLGLAWWDCPKCYGEDFELLEETGKYDTQLYRCKKCGHKEEIPYLGL